MTIFETCLEDCHSHFTGRLNVRGDCIVLIDRVLTGDEPVPDWRLI